ncbi:MAG: hypothetical protein JNK68_00170 [Betaproteobacteria bacterium]|nr:hypothetical protein [Betaproteobacteria bacterium]
MNTKALCVSIALMGTAGFTSTVMAGVACSAREGGCKAGKPAIASKAQSQVLPSQTAQAPTFYSPPLVAPIWTSPWGQTYGRWAAEWYQWALGIPAAVNPLVDQDGSNCAQRQVDAVWFLAGVPGSGSATRRCQIPVGKALFFPLINTIYGAFLNDPANTRTETFVRNAGSCTEPARISVKIDGFQIPHPEKHFTGPSGSQSPIFNVQLPPGNIFGLDENAAQELVLSPSAEQGYYLFVWPLKPGHHTIKWQASGCTAGATQDITYHLLVK